MTWHLKDRELEKKLIAIDPDVSMGATASLVLLIFIVIACIYTFPGE